MPRLLIILFTLAVTLGCSAQEACQSDTVKHKRNIVDRFIDYINNSNKPKPNKPFDASIIAGPHYTSDKGFGIGVAAGAQYRMSMTDTLIQPSSVSLTFNGTTGRYFSLSLDGLHIFPHDKMRLTYLIELDSYRTYFWGLGYTNAINEDNKSRYQYFRTYGNVDLSWQLKEGLFIGPKAAVSYVRSSKAANPQLWAGLPMSSTSFGIGFTAKYDTRDYITNAYSGILLSLDQIFYPKFIGNKHPFTSTTFIAAYFHKLWKGAVFACKYEADLTYGSTPWGMQPTFGGSHAMRGYYEGQYRDKCAMTAVVELRQYVWKRFGVVAWGGAGQVFPTLKSFNVHHTLPNYGAGIRWEFKQRMNVRLDVGFGRHCNGFVFNINEAF